MTQNLIRDFQQIIGGQRRWTDGVRRRTRRNTCERPPFLLQKMEESIKKVKNRLKMGKVKWW